MSQGAAGVVVIGRMDWSSSNENRAVACVRCTMLTRGRMKVKGKDEPACCGCALTLAMDAGAAVAKSLANRTRNGRTV